MSIELERRNRIRASLFAYAYEVKDESLVTDHYYDQLCLRINPEVRTGHKVLDDFFRDQYDAYTGSWIHKHPEFDKVAALYLRVRKYFP